MAKKIAWTDEAKADVRAIAHFVATGEGDVKRLQDVDPPEYRLRVGDYRVRFYDYRESIEILAVKNRREAYR
jgi:mRNA-degrading endonuclease RelE of RelBE toxin-antitoxin system